MLNFQRIHCPVLFADDFVGGAETGSALQRLVDTVHNYSKCWRFEISVKRCAVVIFSKVDRVSSGLGW